MAEVVAGLQVLVCVKRVPDVSGQVLLTPDEQGVDGRYVGFTVSNQESCAVELAIQLVEDAGGGGVTVLSLGTSDAVEQLRSVLGLGASAAVHIEADPTAFGPVDVAREIAAVVVEHQQSGTAYDLVLLGNDAADSGDFQVPVRLAYAVGHPVVTGVKNVRVEGTTAMVEVDAPDGGTERYELGLPAVLAVLEGGVEPRYPSIKGRMAAKKVAIETRTPTQEPIGSSRVRLTLPPPTPREVQILGEGPQAAGRVADLLHELGVSR